MILSLLIVGGLNTALASFFPNPAPMIQSHQKMAGSRFLEITHTLDRFQENAQSHLPKPAPEFSVISKWEDPRVNAMASREGNHWQIHIYGGLLQHPDLTDDEVLLVLCHELGHHLGGTPKASRNGWSSCEGQADYWSAKNCGHLLHSPYQTALRLTQMYAQNLMQPSPDLETPDSTKVERTFFGYPSPQCRLDTLVAGFKGLDRPECWFYTEKSILHY
jgi:hypothetical protein